MKRLIITNGDSAAERIQALNSANTVLPWRDVLHDGPVMMVKTLAEQSKQRALFIAGFADMALEDALADFQRRDHILQGYHTFDRVELWFEHDLYDQLQLMQILHFFEQTAPEYPLYLVQADNYLCEIPDKIFQELENTAFMLAPIERAYGAQAWDAFRAPSPNRLNDLVNTTAALPYIRSALQRLQREYPDKRNGLPFSLFLALSPLLKETRSIKDLFLAMQQAEEAKFMGDLSFCRSLEGVITSSTPLLSGTDSPLQTTWEIDYRDFFQQQVQLTPFGANVLQNQACHIDKNGIDRWIGGVHLKTHATFYFNPQTRSVS